MGVLCLWWFIEGNKRTRGLRNTTDTNHVSMALLSFLYLSPLSYCCGLEDQKPAAHCIVTARDSKAQEHNGYSPFSTKKGSLKWCLGRWAFLHRTLSTSSHGTPLLSRNVIPSETYSLPKGAEPQASGGSGGLRNPGNWTGPHIA